MVKFSESPIYQPQSLVVVVNHDIMRLHISVHYSLRVAVVQSFQHFIDVESNVIICEAFVEGSEINIASVDVLHDKSRSFSHWVSDNVDQIDNVDATSKSLQNLDLSSYLSFFDGF